MRFLPFLLLVLALGCNDVAPWKLAGLTKASIEAEYGPPNRVDTEGGLESWYYDAAPHFQPQVSFRVDFVGESVVRYVYL